MGGGDWRCGGGDGRADALEEGREGGRGIVHRMGGMQWRPFRLAGEAKASEQSVRVILVGRGPWSRQAHTRLD